MCAYSDGVRAAGGEQEHGELLAMLHDLRQPVAAIRFLLDVVRARPDLPTGLPLRLDQLDEQARWMSELLHEYLAGRTELAVPGAPCNGTDASDRREPSRPVRLDRVAARVAERAAAGHSARLVIDPGGPVPVAVAETALRRALANLLDNAFRAAGPTGMVRVRVGDDDDGAFVSVDDDGPGFGRVGSGSRLGLSTVAEMAVSAGGGLEIGRSDLGGARVSVRLPVSRAARVGTLTSR